MTSINLPHLSINDFNSKGIPKNFSGISLVYFYHNACISCMGNDKINIEDIDKKYKDDKNIKVYALNTTGVNVNFTSDWDYTICHYPVIVFYSDKKPCIVGYALQTTQDIEDKINKVKSSCSYSRNTC